MRMNGEMHHYEAPLEADGMNRTLTERRPIHFSLTIENVLLLAWCVFFILLPVPELRSVQEAVIIISPLLILWKYGAEWRNSYKIWNILTLAYVFFFAFTLVSQFVTIDFWRGLNQIRAFHLKFAAVFLSLLFLGRKSENLRLLMWGITAAIVVCVSFGYYAYLAPEGWEIWEPNSPKFGLSAMGLYKNDYAAYFAFYLPMVFGLFLYQWLESGIHSWKTVLLFLLVCLSIPLLLLTKSRASQLAVIVGILFCMGTVMYHYRSVRLPLFLIFFLILLLSIGSVFTTEYGQEALQRWSDSNVFQSWQGRVGIWSEIWEDAKKHFWFGLDFSGESYWEVINYYQGEHSLYLYYMVRSGLLGLIGFLFMSLVIVGVGIKKIFFEMSGRDAVLISGVLGSFFGGYLVRGTVAHYYTFFDTFIILSLLYIVLIDRSVEDDQSVNS